MRGLNYLTPHAFWNITDFGAKCERCENVKDVKSIVHPLQGDYLKKRPPNTITRVSSTCTLHCELIVELFTSPPSLKNIISQREMEMKISVTS
jgi:hypothetical protein